MLNIYTPVCGRPDLLELQVRAFTKYMQEPFKFHVLNNTVFDHKQEYWRVRDMCKWLNVDCIDVLKDETLAKNYEKYDLPENVTFGSDGGYLNANVAGAYPLAWAWENVIKFDEAFLICHSDVFPASFMTPTRYLNDRDMVYVPSGKVKDGKIVKYIWDAFAMFRPNLPNIESLNWWCGQMSGIAVDVGGQTARYLQAHHELRRLEMQQHHVPDDGTPGSNYDMFTMDVPPFGPVFLHYRSGSNWNHRSKQYHEQKTEWLKSKI